MSLDILTFQQCLKCTSFLVDQYFYIGMRNYIVSISGKKINLISVLHKYRIESASLVLNSRLMRNLSSLAFYSLDGFRNLLPLSGTACT